MQNILMDLLAAALFAEICLHMNVYTAGTFHDAYLSREQTGQIRGALAIMILFHHLAGIGGGLVFSAFRRIGGLLVSVFFCYSGYGLMKSHLESTAYRENFLRNRIPAVAIPYLLANVIYWCLYRCLGYEMRLSRLLSDLSYGGLLVSYSWYVVVILLFYVAFYFLMLLGQRKLLIIAASALYLALWDWVFIRQVFLEYWYGTSHILLVGMLWAAYEKKIVEWITRHYKWALLTLLMLVPLLFAASRPFSGGMKKIIQGVMYVDFALLILTLQMKVSLNSGLLRRVGGISLEIYMYQGIFLGMGWAESLQQRSLFFWSLSVFAGTLILARICHWLTAGVIRKLRKTQ